MNRRAIPSGRTNRESGSASVEYAVACAVIVVALFVPVGGDGSSVIDLLMDALRDFQASTTLLHSLP